MLSPLRRIRARERPCTGCTPAQQSIPKSNSKITRGGTKGTTALLIFSKDATVVPLQDLDWLVGWLVGWLDGWMDGWLVGWLISRLIVQATRSEATRSIDVGV
jgi:hypothetical protein